MAQLIRAVRNHAQQERSTDVGVSRVHCVTSVSLPEGLVDDHQHARINRYLRIGIRIRSRVDELRNRLGAALVAFAWAVAITRVSMANSASLKNVACWSG